MKFVGEREMYSFHFPWWWRVIKIRKEKQGTGYRAADNEVDGVETRAQKVRRQMLKHRYTAESTWATKVGEAQERLVRCQEWKPGKEDRCWHKNWIVSHGCSGSRIREFVIVETAVTDHKLKRVVAIKPTQDCISPTIKYHWIIQGEIYHL